MNPEGTYPGKICPEPRCNFKHDDNEFRSAFHRAEHAMEHEDPTEQDWFRAAWEQATERAAGIAERHTIEKSSGRMVGNGVVIAARIRGE